MTFNSVGYGTSQFVSVRQFGQGGAFFSLQDVQGGATIGRDVGQDVTAVVNGTLAVGNGLEVQLNTPALALELVLTPAYAQTIGVQRAFEIAGGGAIFQLGPEISFGQQVGLGVQSVAESRLGGTQLARKRSVVPGARSSGRRPLALLAPRHPRTRRPTARWRRSSLRLDRQFGRGPSAHARARSRRDHH